MIFKQCYFISWLGRVREGRLALLHEAVKWAQSHDFSIHIIAMQWKEEEYEQFPGIDFIKLNKRLPPGHARNIALNFFYATSDDLCIILDDDTYIAEGDSIIQLLRDRPVKGVLYSVRDSKMPRVECTRTRFERPEQITSGVFIVRQELQLFFNTDFKYYKNKLLWGEDVNLLGRIYDRGLRAYEVVTSRTNKSRERDITPSTWHTSQDFSQTERHYEINSKDFNNLVTYNGGDMIIEEPIQPFEM